MDSDNEMMMELLMQDEDDAAAEQEQEQRMMVLTAMLQYHEQLAAVPRRGGSKVAKPKNNNRQQVVGALLLDSDYFVKDATNTPKEVSKCYWGRWYWERWCGTTLPIRACLGSVGGDALTPTISLFFNFFTFNERSVCRKIENTIGHDSYGTREKQFFYLNVH
jgi:hypothetical protein